MLYDEADLYDTLLPASAAELSYYSNLARNHPTAALELACGSGSQYAPYLWCGLDGVRETLERILGEHGVEGFGLEGQWALKVVSSGISIGMAGAD
jgi:hypothetical protein